MRSTLFTLTCLTAFAVAAGSASAQPVEPQPDTPPDQQSAPEAMPNDATPNAEPAPEPRDDAAWTLYHRAYAAAARGRDDEARALLTELLREHQGHPAAAVGTHVLRTFDTQGVATGPGAALPRGHDDRDPGDGKERPSRGARAELALYQSLNGIAVGIELCIAVGCDEPIIGVGMALMGGGVGLGGSLLSTRDGITPGHRAAINSGTSWGAYNAAMLLAITEPDDSETYALTLLGGQVGGLALGSALWRQARPTEGQVALVNTFGLWSNVLSLLGIATVDSSLEDDDIVKIMLLSGDLGLAVGGYVASRYPGISRGHTLLLDAGGIVGALSGAGTAVLIAGDDLDENTAAGAALVGTVAGLAGAAYLSRGWEQRKAPPARLTLLPNAHGGLSAGVMFDLDL